MIILKSNEFWGRRSGSMIYGAEKKDPGSRPSPGFRQTQWGTGKSGNGRVLPKRKRRK